MKKLFFLLLLTLFLAVLLSVGIFAEDRFIAEGKGGENIIWKLYDRNSEDAETPDYHLVFSGSGALRGYTEDGGPLGFSTRDKSQFVPWRDYIHTVEVEEGINSIESAGLAFLPELRTVELPTSVTVLGGAAFESDSRLDRISVKGNPTFLGADLSNITSIGSYCFDGCASLRYLLLGERLGGQIGTEAFKSLTRLISVTIPKGVTALSGDVFENCSALESVVFLGDPTLSSTVFLNANKNVKLYGAKSSGNVQRFAMASGLTFENSTPVISSEFYDPSAIDIGKCGTEESELYYKIIPEGDGHTMYTFGPGSTMTSSSVYDTGTGYYSMSKCYWYPHRKLITKIVISDNVRTMTGIACGFMPNLKYVEVSENLTAITGACFEASSSFGTLYVRGNEPVEGHIDLTNVVKLGSYTFDGCHGIKTVEFARYTSSKYLGTEYFKNCTELRSVRLPFDLVRVSEDAFLGCTSLTEVTFYSDPVFSGDPFVGCTNLEAIAGLRNSHAQEYAEANGIRFILPNIVSVYLENEYITETDVVDGCVFSPQLVDGAICLFYTDEKCTEPFDLSTLIYDDISLYAKHLISHNGFAVRTRIYNGLRSIYDIDISAIRGDSLYNIAEMGVIASLERSIRGGADFDLDDHAVFKSLVVQNGSLVGKLAAYPEGNTAQIAYTAKGFENGNALNAKNVTEPLFFRGYAVIENRETGETYTLYTDIASATLKESSSSVLERSSDELSDAERSFLSRSADIKYDRDMLYTKEELMAYMEQMYADSEHILYGQHIDCSTQDSFSNFLTNFKLKTGDYPAVVGIDQGTINGGKMTEEELAVFREDLVEYAKRGGIISMSFHMDNPTDESLYCRGTLGMGEAFDALMTPGTETNASLMRSLATAADTLQFLEDRGIPVLWRPLHEMNGGWFWWCTVQSGKVLDGEYVARLWRYFYNYFENECDLDNLIWVYSPNYSNNTSVTSGTQDVLHCYPGDDYVDIVGCDWYSGTGNPAEIDGAGKSYSKIVSTGKPACITEFGPSGSLLPTDGGEHPYSALDQLQLMKDVTDMGFSMIYILNWTSHWSIYSMPYTADFMENEMIYGANESYISLIGSKLQ